MQLGLLKLLLQCTAKDGGDNSWALLLRHKQQLQLTARCLHHAAALQYVTNLLDQKHQIEEEANAAAHQRVHLKERTTATQQLLLRTAGSMAPQGGGARGNGTAASNACDQKQMEPPLHDHCNPPDPASDPREDMMKFRQCDLFCFFDGRSPRFLSEHFSQSCWR
jgi:hypothetical protein